MQKRSSKLSRHDVNQLAASIVRSVTQSAKKEPEKNPAAVALGRMGGLKGGKARADKLTPEERAKIAKKAAQARWGSEGGDIKSNRSR